MHTRLLIGRGSLGETLLDALEARPGRTVAVRQEGVPQPDDPSIEVIEGDPTDPGVIGRVAGVETVVVADERPEWNLAAAGAAREAFPDAFLLAYAGRESTGETRTALGDLADRLVDPRDVLGTYLTERVVTGPSSMQALQSVLADIEGPLAVLTHDNPDPDAIASAVALERIAERSGTPAQACYFGSINHQENRAMVNLLEYDLRQLDAETDLDAFGGFALVDHARPGVNDGLPEGTAVDVVVDHHPPRGPVAARFTDLRSDVGATSTLLVDYYRRLGAEPGADVATGLLFGIRVDTDEFRREVSVADFEAGAFLLEHADLGALERIENPSMSPDTLETIAASIVNRERYGSVLLSGVGEINDRDTLAQAADRLLGLEGVTTTLVYGIKDGMIYVSARARGTDLDLGEALRTAFGQIGSAGGHADMAGAQIELGVIERVAEADQSLEDIVEGVVSDRVLDALETYPSQVSLGTYGTRTGVSVGSQRGGWSEGRHDGGLKGTAERDSPYEDSPALGENRTDDGPSDEH